MHYYVDGYNLMFRNLHAGEDLQKQRDSLIYGLNKRVAALKLSVTLVFDAMHTDDEATRGHYNALVIVYTAKGQSADDYIVHAIKHEANPRQVTLVTSDRKLSDRARILGAKTERIEEFTKWLNTRYKNALRKKAPSTQFDTLKYPQRTKIAPLPAVHNPVPTQEDKDLKAFEEKFDGLVKENPIKKFNAPTRSAKHKQDEKEHNLPEEEGGLSDFDRWLELFENRSDE